MTKKLDLNAGNGNVKCMSAHPLVVPRSALDGGKLSLTLIRSLYRCLPPSFYLFFLILYVLYVFVYNAVINFVDKKKSQRF